MQAPTDIAFINMVHQQMHQSPSQSIHVYSHACQSTCKLEQNTYLHPAPALQNVGLRIKPIPKQLTFIPSALSTLVSNMVSFTVRLLFCTSFPSMNKKLLPACVLRLCAAHTAYLSCSSPASLVSFAFVMLLTSRAPYSSSRSRKHVRPYPKLTQLNV